MIPASPAAYNDVMKGFSLAAKNQQFFLSLLGLIAIVLQHFSPDPLFASLVLVIVALAISFTMPSHSANTRVVLSFSLIAITLQLHLTLRGFISDGPINVFDFSLIFTCLLISGMLVTFTKSFKNRSYLARLDWTFVSGASGFLAVTCMALVMRSQGIGSFLAWSSSGDSRNHVQAIYELSAKGDMSVYGLGSTPLARVVAVYLNSGSPTNLFSDSSSRLLSDLTAHTTTWIILIGILGFAFAAVWDLILRSFGASTSRIAVSIFPISIFAASSFTLGTFLKDGFITALAGVIALTLAAILAFDDSSLGKFENPILIVGCLFIAFTSWTIVVIPTLIILSRRIYVWLNIHRDSKAHFVKLAALVLGALGAWLVFKRVYAASFEETLNYPGSISPIDSRILIALLLMMSIISVISIGSLTHVAGIFLIICIAVISSIQIMLVSSNTTYASQSYYIAKFVTILTIALVPVALAFIPLMSQISIRTNSNYVLKGVAAGLLLVSLLQVVSEMLSPVPGVWSRIRSGWIQPSPEIIDLVLSLPNDPKNPTVLFKFRPDDPGATRLGDFWLGTYANPREPYQSWSYVGNQEGDMRSFCALNEGYPTMTVITRDPNLSTRMFGYCPEEEIDIEWVP